MKKKMFPALLGMVCLLLISISVQAQVSRNGSKKAPTEVSKEEPANQQSGTTLSRKRAPGNTSTTKDQPVYRQEGTGVSRGGTTVSTGRTRGGIAGRRTAGKELPKGGKYKMRSGKAKCGVAGCQYPGKHKGLHKQQKRVHPIRRKH